MNIVDYPIKDLLPHDPPMVLLDGVEACQEDFIHTSLVIRQEIPFCENGAVPAYVGLEYMAQAVAAWSGWIARQQGLAPKIGFLLGARRLTLNVTHFKIAEKLDIYAKNIYQDGEMAAFDCWIEINSVRVAQAGLNVFQPK